MAERIGVADPGDVAQLDQLNRITILGGDAGGGPWLGELEALERRWVNQVRIVELNQAELESIEKQIAELKALAKEKGWT